ncbi:MAG: nicotinamide-nucleotide amidohydrolase family protein [Chitinivibrionales bacterium]|nr:nicotinamide-nucleotide amidohydrolase family protein [Chitinivibrionales bacterium]MBD3358862.1 nicotinamide-nucleotide amidohydrolase family protein [Chitinivibrionales bacterium]
MVSLAGWRELVESARKLGVMLLDRSMNLSVAESCTGGMIGATITANPGSSAYFRGGVIAYDNAIKERILAVPAEILLRHGAVSGQTVTAMATGVCRLMQTECGMSVSGVAGPEGGTVAKPVGLVYIGVHSIGRSQAFRYLFKGNRDEIRKQAVEKGLERMNDALKSQD